MSYGVKYYVLMHSLSVLLEEALVFVPWVTPGTEIKERQKMEASLPGPSHYFNVSAESSASIPPTLSPNAGVLSSETACEPRMDATKQD